MLSEVQYYVKTVHTYSLDGLRKTIPETLDSVSAASNNQYYHCMRIIDAYRGGFTYGTKSSGNCNYIKVTVRLLTNQSGNFYFFPVAVVLLLSLLFCCRCRPAVYIQIQSFL